MISGVVEDAILNAVENDNISGNSDDAIGIINDNNNLFIKFKLSEEAITVMMIEPYSLP